MSPVLNRLVSELAMQEEEKTKAAMQDMFKSHDGDNSGSLDAAEMADLLKSLGFGLYDDQIEGVLEEVSYPS